MKLRRRFRLILQNYYQPEIFGLIGEGGRILEVDESKFKRKHNRGRLIRRGWVLGLVERGEGNKKIMIAVPDRSANTLMEILNRWLNRDTIAIMVYFH